MNHRQQVSCQSILHFVKQFFSLILTYPVNLMTPQWWTHHTWIMVNRKSQSSLSHTFLMISKYLSKNVFFVTCAIFLTAIIAWITTETRVQLKASNFRALTSGRKEPFDNHFEIHFLCHYSSTKQIRIELALNMIILSCVKINLPTPETYR